MLLSTFNFARRSVAYSLALHISPLLLPGIDCGQATSTTGSEVDASLSRPEYLIRVSTGLNLIQTASHDSSAHLLYEDGNRLHQEDAAVCGLTAVILGLRTGHFPKRRICFTHYTRIHANSGSYQCISPESAHYMHLVRDY